MLECVPNFSEGQDRAKLDAIVDAIRSVPSIKVLGAELDPDHHRSVVTFAGPAAQVVEAAVRGAGKAAELIHLPEHQGVHPRVGATDVLPFIPLAGSSMADAVMAADVAGHELWTRYGIPVYFYESAARSAERRRLEKVRRSGFDGKPPDIGDVPAHPTAGATMVGARDFLVAYNVYLDTDDLVTAQVIARKIRESNGGFRFVKAIGLPLASHGRTQVSMNLTNFAQTDLDAVYQAIVEEAERLGTAAGPGEIIGFVPQAAFDKHPDFFRRAENFSESRILEIRLAEL